MLFNSIAFAIYLPIVFLLYWFVFNRNLRLQNLFVVAASYVFYGWWDWRFLFLIAFTSFCSWGSGLLIEKYRGDGNKSKWISAGNIAVNLGILFVFKYYDFFVNSFADVFLGGKTDGLLLSVILPVGISFYTFQALGYSIDVYKEKQAPTRDIVEFFAFVSFFPQLVAGPIERATNLLPQFQKKRVFDYSQAVDGCRQILWGLFKKMVVADNCAVYVDEVFGNCQNQSGSTLLLAAVLFTVQLYGDFSGYSDIAIGTSKLFGIRLKRNFNVPFFSRNISEFWRRWHISLNSWFKDYVYIPLGGNRCSMWKQIRNIFIVFLLSGLWHGAKWTFVAWGFYLAVIYSVSVLAGWNKKYPEVVAYSRKLPTIKEFFQVVFTFMLVVIGFIFFRSQGCGMAISYLAGIIDGSLFSVPVLFHHTELALTMCVLMLVVEWIFRRKDFVFDYSSTSIPRWVQTGISYLVLFTILQHAQASQSFIYFQF